MAMTLEDTIRGRRSVRSYSQEAVPNGIVRQLLELAVRAPTAMDREPWAFVVVRDRKLLQRISDLEMALHPGVHSHGIFYDAGTLIVICGRGSGEFIVADCWLAAENLMLAAYSIGLGTCCIGSAVAALNDANMKRELGIPPEVVAIAPIITGYPRGDEVPMPRKAPDIITWRAGPT